MEKFQLGHSVMSESQKGMGQNLTQGLFTQRLVGLREAGKGWGRNLSATVESFSGS